jgi:hypothetical protein
MSPTYSEGKEKVLKRLSKELDSTRGTLSIIPFSRDGRLVGLEPQLAELEAKLLVGEQIKKVAIVGEGGTGKSQLALKFAYRTREKNKSCSIFWIDASDIDSLEQAYSGIARKLAISGWDDEKADVKQLVKSHLGMKSARQWLLIFDNADDLNLGSAKLSTPRSTNLIDYLPQSKLGYIIFTTTNSEIAEMLEPQTILEMQEMLPDTAQRMLGNYLIKPVSTSKQQEAMLLLKELSYLPLAIVQAAAYINVRNITLKDYRLRIIKERNEALELSNGLAKSKLQSYGIESPITMTTLISLDQIRKDNLLATQYLFLAACVDRKDVPLDFLETVSSREREDTVEVLNAYALITRRPAESAIDLHRLVHLATRNWLQNQEWLEEWTQKAILRLLEVFPDDNYGNRSKWRRLLPHANYALSYDLAEQESEGKISLIYKCAKALLDDGRYNESERLFGQVMETKMRVLGEKHPDTLTSMVYLASTFWNQGRWKEVEELEVRVIATNKRVLGEEHPDTLTSIYNLALTFKGRGRDEEAIGLISECIQRRTHVLGAGHPLTLYSIEVLDTWKLEDLDIN